VIEPVFRLADRADKPRILEIAGTVWEGDDYIPAVIDDWLRPGSAQLVVATIDGVLVALARYDRTFPRYAWFEGLRTDPAYQGRGLAKALTGRLVQLAEADGADRIGLSTYFDNYASQKVSAAFGFAPVATFAASSADAAVVRRNAAFSPAVEDVPLTEAAAFVSASVALRLGRDFLPHSWRFYPFARGPQIALGHMERLLGLRRGGSLVALLCIGDSAPHGPAGVSLDFLEGDASDLDTLVRHALYVVNRGKYWEAMVPCLEERATAAMPVLKEMGFEFWNNGREDVIVFEKDLTAA
jgi:GNAT superfamily N-acetyltransferase